jgi:uncharacterized protein (TIGR03000 family)
MLARTSRVLVVGAVLGAVGLHTAPAEAQSILGIVPRIARGVGRALFGPWDRFAPAGRFAYAQAHCYAPTYWSHGHPEWLVGAPGGPAVLLSDGQTAPAMSQESDFQLAAHRAGSADLASAVAALAGQLPANGAGIVVSMPADAKLFVNGAPSNLTGRVRKLFSRNLQPGKRYPYELRAEAFRDGRVVSQSKSLELVAGATEAVTFPPQIETPAIAGPRSPQPTTLVVHVPTDAKVYLLGNETRATGPVRRFTTDLLPAGERTAYTLRVTVRRGSRMISQERRITLEGGRTHEQHFMFGVATPGERVAEESEQPSAVGDQLFAIATGDKLLEAEDRYSRP